MRRERLSLMQLVPNMVTIIGMCAGLTSIRFTFDGRFELAAALIIFAAVMDAFDGLIARKLNATSSFGAELDSFADFVSFGVAPGILVFVYALASPIAGIGWVFVLVFSVCACLRLARFNISRATPGSGSQRYFVGVPAPAGAMLGLMPVFLGLAELVEPSRAPFVVSVYMGAVGLLMVSRLPTPSIKMVRIARDNAMWVLLGLTVFAGLLLLRTWATLVAGNLIYLGLLVWVAARRKRGRAPE